MARIVEKSGSRLTVTVAVEARDYTTLDGELFIVMRDYEIKQLATALSDAGYVVTEPTG